MSLVIDVGSPFYGNRRIESNEDDRSVEDEDGCVSDAETSSIGEGESSVSSVGSCSSDEAEEEESERTRKEKDCFDSMDSLDGSLPSTRGLSNFFNGKSKSFAALSDVVTSPATVADLAKQENPFNKKRRILMAKKGRWPRRASCGSLSSASACLPPLPPHLPNSVILSQVEEEEDDGDLYEGGNEREDVGGDDICSSSFNSSSHSHGRQLNSSSSSSFKSPRSFSVGDLRRHFES